MEKIVHLDAIAIPAAFPLPRPNCEHEWISYETTKYEDIAARCAEATVVVTNKCRLTAENMAKMPKLKLVAELATGYNNIDIDYCREHNIAVTTIQGYINGRAYLGYDAVLVALLYPDPQGNG